MKQVTAVLVGAGGRGAQAYASFALRHPELLKIVAVCEPIGHRRSQVQLRHRLRDDACFESYEDILKRPQLADFAMICTQDHLHFDPAIQLMEIGYDLLLEKPMSNNPAEIMKIASLAERLHRKVVICHVLRYTAFFREIKKRLELNAIGKIMSIHHSENIAYWHFAMSYVRGAWRNEALSSPMILAKCCHDMDIFNWLIDSDCVKIASFGSLRFFKEENAPVGAPMRCLDGCPHQELCPWYAPRFYSEHMRFLELYTDSEASMPLDQKLEKLHQSNHGRCVFHSDNDVVDQQVTLLEYEDGTTVSFSASAFTYDNTRLIRIMGSQGEITGNLDQNILEIRDFLTGKKEVIHLTVPEGDDHFGGDFCLMQEVVEVMQPDYVGDIRSAADVSVKGHMMAFAAEQARKEEKVVRLETFMQSFKD